MQFDPLSTEDKIKRGKKGVKIMHAAQPIFTHCKNESTTRLFFSNPRKKRKMGPFPLPIYKSIPKTVFGPCLQSELENRSQGKSTFVKTIEVYY